MKEKSFFWSCSVLGMDSVLISVFGSVSASGLASVFFGFFIWLFLWLLFLLSGKAIQRVLPFAILWDEG
jgi:hypothetical protein